MGTGRSRREDDGKHVVKGRRRLCSRAEELMGSLGLNAGLAEQDMGAVETTVRGAVGEEAAISNNSAVEISQQQNEANNLHEPTTSVEQNRSVGQGMGVEMTEGGGALLEESPIANNFAQASAIAMDVSQEQKQTSNHREFIDLTTGDGVKQRKTIALPLEVGAGVLCRWRDGKLHPVKVVDRRKLRAGSDDYQYYVHYDEFDKRLDEWVNWDQLELECVGADANGKTEEKAGGKKLTRRQKRKAELMVADKVQEDPAKEKETRVKNISKIELGRFEIDTWYFSPFPPEYSDCHKLFFCEFCLTFVKRKEQLARHMRKCDLKHPPGNEIYRKGSLSMFEVDGKKNKIYTQNLCYLAKLFLEHKTLYYDVDYFLFYILCECDDRGCHIVGYFSKEKHSEDGYNLACILTLPPFQRKGYGKFLIAFSYELSKKEGKVGTPEKPLSDLGNVSYRAYWTRILLDILKKSRGNVSIKELSDMTAIRTDDVINTLNSLELIQYRKGAHIIVADPKLLDDHLKAAGRSSLDVDTSKLLWTPYKEQGG